MSIENLGHFSFMLIALSFWVRDLFFLRWLSAAASVCAVIYNLFGVETTLWMVVFWHTVFIGIHTVRIKLMIQERRAVDFTAEEKELFDTVFTAFTPVEYKKLMRIAHWVELPEGRVLTHEGQDMDKIRLLYNGRAKVTHKGREITTLSDGKFIGEMSFSTDAAASATVTTSTDCRFVEWHREELDALLKRNPAMRNMTLATLTTDMARKLSQSVA